MTLLPGPMLLWMWPSSLHTNCWAVRDPWGCWWPRRGHPRGMIPPLSMAGWSGKCGNSEKLDEKKISSLFEMDDWRSRLLKWTPLFKLILMLFPMSFWLRRLWILVFGWGCCEMPYPLFLVVESSSLSILKVSSGIFNLVLHRILGTIMVTEGQKSW